MPKVSVIVPVYKVEQYIRECLDSIKNQTFTDWECLLIDDGSPDDSGRICDEYAAKDCRFKVLHKPNGGVSSARNLGLDKACGEWVMFVDADDVIAPNTIEVCVRECIENKLDLVQFSFTRIKSFGTNDSEKPAPLALEEYIKEQKYNVCVGGSMMRKSIIEEKQIRFDTKLKLAEDQLFIYQYMDSCEILQKIDTELYWYRDNDTSASRNQKSTDIENSIPKLSAYKKLHPHWNPIIDKINTMFIVDIINNKDRTLSQVSKLLRIADIKCLSLLSGTYRVFGYIQMISPNLATLFIKFRYNHRSLVSGEKFSDNVLIIKHQ